MSAETWTERAPCATQDMAGDELVMANTFSRPIRDKLPYFFPAAWRALQWVDPGLTGDVYADKPEVYGSVLGSANYLAVPGPGDADGSEAGPVVVAEAMPADVPQKPSARRKHFLQDERRRRWTWRRGVEYRWDFCNDMMDFNGFPPRPPPHAHVLRGY